MRDAFGLLTTLGRRGGALTARSLGWFPAVGALLGAVLGGWWWLADRWWPPAVAAALVVAADLALTGMLHVDGLADAADGLLPHASRDHRLTIMRASDVGAFGVAVVAVVLLLRVLTLASHEPDVPLLIGLWCASRSIVASVPAFVPYARDAGIASPLLAGAPRWPALAVVPAAFLAGFAVAGVVVGAAAVIGLSARRVGGFTGDVLGAAIVVGETVGLVIASATW